MHKINFDKKMTYWNALWLPFKIAPGCAIIFLLNDMIRLFTAPLGVWAMSRFIDEMFSVFQYGGKMYSVLFALLLMVVLRLYQYIANPILGLVKKRYEQKNWMAIDHPLIPTYAGLELKNTEDAEKQDLITRVWSEAPHIALPYIWSDFEEFIVQLSIIISYIVILLSNAPLAGAVILIAAVPAIILARKLGKERYKKKKSLTQNNRELQEMQYYFRERQYASERKLFDYTEKMNEKYIKLTNTVRKAEVKLFRKNLFLKNLSSILLICLGSSAFFLFLPYVKNGTMSVGAYISLIGVLFSTISNVTWNFPSYFENFAINSAYLKDFNEYLMLGKEKGALDEMAETVEPFQKLEFRNVSFKYPGTEKEILKNISFVIESGKSYAIVGINGSGKTTIVKLILRLYSDYEGEILLNGKPLAEYPMAQIKAMFSAVFQDYAQYDVSLSDNINIGAGLHATYEEIDRAISESGLDDVVKNMKHGKDTLLGKIYDDGIELSQGQWQRVAIARALISPAQLKIMDEPTASLDPIAEQEVYAHFNKIKKNTTTIFITHRLASVKDIDTILVLNDGKIDAKGNHNELLEKNGLYAEMFASQQGWYI